MSSYQQNTHHLTHNRHTHMENNMSNKNPFELRFDVLKMAKEMMDQQHEIANNQFYQMVDQAREQNKNIQEVFEKYTPKMYQPKEIMDKADELYKFITKRD